MSKEGNKKDQQRLKDEEMLNKLLSNLVINAPNVSKSAVFITNKNGEFVCSDFGDLLKESDRLKAEAKAEAKAKAKAKAKIKAEADDIENSSSKDATKNEIPDEKELVFNKTNIKYNPKEGHFRAEAFFMPNAVDAETQKELEAFMKAQTKILNDAHANANSSTSNDATVKVSGEAPDHNDHSDAE